MERRTMTYSVFETYSEFRDGVASVVTIYITSDNKKTCNDNDLEFQQWLRDNADNLPADIQEKVDDGTLVIQEADNGAEYD